MRRGRLEKEKDRKEGRRREGGDDVGGERRGEGRGLEKMIRKGSYYRYRITLLGYCALPEYSCQEGLW